MTSLTRNYHNVLAKSYLVFFLAITLGLLLDTIFEIRLHFSWFRIVSIIFLILGPLIILWAQYTSRFTADPCAPDKKREYFLRGPYKYIRNPTQLGIMLLLLGYSLVNNSLILFSLSVVAYLISNIFFKQYEHVLTTEFGEEYSKYKACVRKIV